MLLRRCHRLTVTFLVMMSLLLPLQGAWAAAEAYCGYETAAGASAHLGGHLEVQQAEDLGAMPEASAAKNLPVDGDCGCACCHLSTAATAPALAEVPRLPTLSSDFVASAPRAHESALVRAPDRPQWPRLV